MRRSTTSRLGRWSGAAALAVLLAPAAAGQIPDKFTNLKSLPATTSKAELVAVMRGFAGALGVRCNHCHAGPDRPNLAGMDFASDEKEAKRTARAMMAMVKAINHDYLAKLGKPKVVQVECLTCHRGSARPQTLDAVMAEALSEKGLSEALALYRSLRKEDYGNGRYDFSERPLNHLGESLVDEGRAAEAAALLELNVEFNPPSSWTQFLLGEAYRAGGRREQAKAAYAKSLELNPANGRAQRRLQELAAPESPAPQP